MVPHTRTAAIAQPTISIIDYLYSRSAARVSTLRSRTGTIRAATNLRAKSRALAPARSRCPRRQDAVMIAPLSAEDRGSFLATVPDLPGCMSDGETPEEALRNIRDAIGAWDRSGARCR